MAEQTTGTQSKVGIIATAIVAGIVGASGGYVANDQTAVAPVANKIDAVVEHDLAFGARVSGLEAVGMIVSGVQPHIHVKWNATSSVKAYNVYVDGNKINKQPIVVIGDAGRYTAMNGFKAGRAYSVTVTSIGLDGKESPQSDAVSVTIK